uniref:Uncharacterized protein n=1 Tax=viral metagenome TaxID=1070528 RepID=A0A6M3Y1L4_9ZZZZ
MIKTTQKDFAIFKKEFLRWVNIFGLKDWKIEFDREPLTRGYAECRSSLIGRVATIVLTSEIKDEGDAKYFNPARSGKHEAIELLLAPLDITARYRYISQDNVDEATHTIIRVLEKVLK